MHSDTSLPQIPPSVSQGLGPVLAPTRAEGSQFHLAPDGDLDEIMRNRREANARPASSSNAGPASVRELPQFEHGAGI